MKETALPNGDGRGMFWVVSSVFFPIVGDEVKVPAFVDNPYSAADSTTSNGHRVINNATCILGPVTRRHDHAY